MGKAYLVLENGDRFQGEFFGYEKEIKGEVVFTTGMTGYLETLTDPSYFGQIVIQTFPLIGNYGVIGEDFESRIIGASAYIVKHRCQDPSNFRCEGDLDTFFKEKKVTGLSEIDTRAVTKKIRDFGTMNGVITDRPDEIDLNELREFRAENPVKQVSAPVEYNVKAENSRYRIALFDFGVKENIKRELLARGCDLYVFPQSATADEILKCNPDGIVLSNGPGDPADNTEAIATIRVLCESRIPMLGICLGHQLVALANGFTTEKMKYGHRGANQPVKDIATQRIYITSQNHGFCVDRRSIDKSIATEAFINVNDGTCEGIRYKKSPILTVQFHPEACSGPHDSEFLFDRFLETVQLRKERG